MESILFILKSIVLGIVEGITEFLPVSSTGHVIIFQNMLHFDNAALSPHYIDMYTYVIQLGAILAVVVLYWKRIRKTLINFFPQKVGYDKSGFKFWFTICVACIPGGIIGITLNDIAEKYLYSPYIVAFTLFFGGIWMMYAESKYRNNKVTTRNLNITMKQAIIIGSFQCLAILPGMSRSASTIIGGWIAGLSTVASAEFSFFLAIPVMFGMSGLKIIKMGGLGGLLPLESISLIVGFIMSFVVALLVINKFINYLKHKPMKAFAVYRMIFAIVVILAGVFKFF